MASKHPSILPLNQAELLLVKGGGCEGKNALADPNSGDKRKRRTGG